MIKYPMELIKDNYLRGSGTGKDWHVDIDPPKRKVKSYFEETLLSAEYMYANKTGKLQLLLSGGLDSEYVFRVFEYLKFDFTPIIFRFTGKYWHKDYNYEEYKYALELCESKNVIPTIIDFNFDAWVESGDIFKQMHDIQSGFAGIATQLKLAELLDGFTVMGNDPPYLKYNTDLKTWQLEEEEGVHGLLRGYSKKMLNGCPFLLSYTPEMMLAFLLDPNIIDLVNNEYPGRQGTNSTKHLVFNNGSNFNMSSYDFDSVKKIVEKDGINPFTTTLSLPRIKRHGLEVIYNLPIWTENQERIKNFNIKGNHIYSGCYKENYSEIVSRLSINQ